MEQPPDLTASLKSADAQMKRTLPPWAVRWWAEVRVLSVSMWEIQRGWRWRLIAVLLVALAGVAFLVYPNDTPWLEALHAGEKKGSYRQAFEIAGALGKYGDFRWWNIGLFLVLLLAARLGRSRFVRSLATASLLGAVFTGLAVNVVRFSTGRPRPKIQMADGFYGPSLSEDFHSFPSGHTAATSGAAWPLLVACPAVGVPAAVVAGSVAWARMRRNLHHPSDIATSVIAAAAFGIPLGLAVRRLRRRREEEEEARSGES
jgi:membrane-associated phospholipid phosphatase